MEVVIESILMWRAVISGILILIGLGVSGGSIFIVHNRAKAAAIVAAGLTLLAGGLWTYGPLYCIDVALVSLSGWVLLSCLGIGGVLAMSVVFDPNRSLGGVKWRRVVAGISIIVIAFVIYAGINDRTCYRDGGPLISSIKTVASLLRTAPDVSC